MKRSRLLFLNVLILCVLGIWELWVQGYYLSLQSCIDDMLSSRSLNERNIISRHTEGSQTELIYLDEDNLSWHRFVITKTGPLYRTTYEIGNSFRDNGKKLDISGRCSYSEGCILSFWRFDESIVSVKATTNDYGTYELTDWIGPLTFVLIEKDDENQRPWFGLFQGYDKQGNVIEEIDNLYRYEQENAYE